MMSGRCACDAYAYAFLILTRSFGDAARIQRGLLLVAKLLQSLACRTAPNEEYLRASYTALAPEMHKLDNFFKALVVSV